jgi:hypothetical protein
VTPHASKANPATRAGAKELPLDRELPHLTHARHGYAILAGSAVTLGAPLWSVGVSLLMSRSRALRLLLPRGVTGSSRQGSHGIYRNSSPSSHRHRLSFPQCSQIWVCSRTGAPRRRGRTVPGRCPSSAVFGGASPTAGGRSARGYAFTHPLIEHAGGGDGVTGVASLGGLRRGHCEAVTPHHPSVCAPQAAVRSSRELNDQRAPSLILLAAGHAAGVVSTLLGLRYLAAPFPILAAWARPELSAPTRRLPRGHWGRVALSQLRQTRD